MAQGNKEPAPLPSAEDLQAAAKELAAAIRYHAEYTGHQRRGDNARIVAAGLIAWANFVFGGLVITPAISGQEFSPLVIAGGGIVCMGAYLFAVWIMKGGKRK